MDECIHGTDPAWCAICSKVDEQPARVTASRSVPRTKQIIVNDLCRALGMDELAVYEGSSVPVEIFHAVSEQFEIPMGPMPAVGLALATKAGLDWGPDCDSTKTPSGGGSTVTAVGLEVMLKAVRRLSSSGSSDFDPGILHEFLEVIPAGRWTTYGVVGQLSGTGPRGVGSHIRSCVECRHAWRVLEEGGQPSAGFTWSDPADTRSPREVLEAEGLTFESGRADAGAFIDAEELRAIRDSAFRWPTVEWVKEPIDRTTSRPSGRPIRARHFVDCDHWYVDEDGQLIGDPPHLATDGQMRDLPVCRDCMARAEKDANPSVGVRPSRCETAEEPEVSSAPTDVAVLATRRSEQSYLRRVLLDGRNTAPCDLCGQMLPAGLLVAAHIVPRSQLTESERYDFHANAMLACLLGCDALFEQGLLTVDGEGAIRVYYRDEILVRVLQRFRNMHAAGFTEKRALAFSRHREVHEPHDGRDTQSRLM